jgi:hypothetical protein
MPNPMTNAAEVVGPILMGWPRWDQGLATGGNASAQVGPRQLHACRGMAPVGPRQLHACRGMAPDGPRPLVPCGGEGTNRPPARRSKGSVGPNLVFPSYRTLSPFPVLAVGPAHGEAAIPVRAGRSAPTQEARPLGLSVHSCDRSGPLEAGGGPARAKWPMRNLAVGFSRLETPPPREGRAEFTWPRRSAQTGPWASDLTRCLGPFCATRPHACESGGSRRNAWSTWGHRRFHTWNPWTEESPNEVNEVNPETSRNRSIEARRSPRARDSSSPLAAARTSLIAPPPPPARARGSRRPPPRSGRGMRAVPLRPARAPARDDGAGSRPERCLRARAPC